MKKDIEFPIVTGVSMAVILETNELQQKEWRVYLINENNFALDTIFVTSKGYSSADAPKEAQKTSTLRHMIPNLAPKEYAMIEMITPEVFHLNNEYWLSYYVGNQIYDKKFIFLPYTIDEKNLQKITILGKEGILHS
jgi:hypothetical protein